MNSALRLPLVTTPEQTSSLLALQAAFAQACNALAPIVKQTGCWNRVALHHMTYRMLRAAFPGLGSQMICNAIYSVSRACRLAFQHPESPFNLTRLAGKPLPLLRFTDTCPVYFDRHTLSVRQGQLSMFTLDGRMHFQLTIKPEDEIRFQRDKLREIVLSREAGNVFQLSFVFAAEAQPSLPELPAADESDVAVPGKLPEYVLIEENP